MNPNGKKAGDKNDWLSLKNKIPCQEGEGHGDFLEKGVIIIFVLY